MCVKVICSITIADAGRYSAPPLCPQGRIPSVGRVQPVFTKELPRLEELRPIATFAGSQFFIYRSSASSACVWDLDRQLEHGQLEGTTTGSSSFWDIKSSTCGLYAAGLSLDEENGRNALQLWHLHPFRCSAEIVRLAGNVGDDFADSICLLEGGKVMLGTDNGKVELWDLSQGLAAGTIGAPSASFLHRPHESCVRDIKSASLALSLALSGSSDKTLKLWDLRTNSCVRTIQTGHEVCFVDMDASAKVAVSSRDSDSGLVKLWDLGSGRCLAEMSPTSEVAQVAMHESGDAFFDCSKTALTSRLVSNPTQLLSSSPLPKAVMYRSFAATRDFSKVALSCTACTAFIRNCLTSSHVSVWQ